MSGHHLLMCAPPITPCCVRARTTGLGPGHHPLRAICPQMNARCTLRVTSRAREIPVLCVFCRNAARSGEVPLSQTGALVAAGRWHSSDVASSPKRANASQHFHAVPYTHTANTERRRTTVKESNNKKKFRLIIASSWHGRQLRASEKPPPFSLPNARCKRTPIFIYCFSECCSAQLEEKDSMVPLDFLFLLRYVKLSSFTNTAPITRCQEHNFQYTRLLHPNSSLLVIRA